MSVWLRERGLSPTRLVLSACLSLFGLFSAIFVRLTTNAPLNYVYCIATALFVFLPPVLSLLCRFDMSFGFYLLMSLYAVGPLLGGVYRLYYLTSWWDVLLHALSGLIFAVIGAELATTLNRGRAPTLLVSLLFGVFFSATVALGWEFYEFFVDATLGTDMQTDTVVTEIITKLGQVNGSLTEFKDITEVTVNGAPLGLGGYLDIGLVDTVTDMLIGVLGTVPFILYTAVTQGRHPLIRSLPRVGADDRE